MIKSNRSGNKIYFKKGEWFYESDDISIHKDENRKCNHCSDKPTEDGHDPCLGTIIGVKNACCGHGNKEEAYIQFLDDKAIRGVDAYNILNILKKYNERAS